MQNTGIKRILNTYIRTPREKIKEMPKHRFVKYLHFFDFSEGKSFDEYERYWLSQNAREHTSAFLWLLKKKLIKHE